MTRIQGNNAGFLSRWSYRKRVKKNSVKIDAPQAVTEDLVEAKQIEADDEVATLNRTHNLK